MNISENGINLIKQFEGCRLVAYKCPAGVWTIGYGHTGKDVNEGLKITQTRAEELLKLDLERFERTINSAVKVELTQNQFDALCSFCYNVGCVAFRTSTLLKLLNAKDYTGAAQQFTKWIYSNGKVSDGLLRRREKERTLFLKTD